MWQHLPSAQHGAQAEGNSTWEEGAFGLSVTLWSLEGMGEQTEKQQMLCSTWRAEGPTLGSGPLQSAGK